jgi:hypothetical protein
VDDVCVGVDDTCVNIFFNGLLNYHLHFILWRDFGISMMMMMPLAVLYKWKFFCIVCSIQKSH